MSAVRIRTREVGQRHHEHPEHPVGAVDQREALLGDELDRGRGRRPRAPRAAGIRYAVGVAHLALADQRQRAVRERGEVAGAAERAVLVDHRRDARVEDSRPSAPPPQAVRRSGRSPASRGAAASARAPPRARPPDPTRRRASGPATAAAGRASRSGCAGWRARRSRSRSRTPGWARRRARRPRHGPARWRRRASSVSCDRSAFAGDGDALPAKESGPTPTATVVELCAWSWRHATSRQRPDVPERGRPLQSRIRDRLPSWHHVTGHRGGRGGNHAHASTAGCEPGWCARSWSWSAPAATHRSSRSRRRPRDGRPRRPRPRRQPRARRRVLRPSRRERPVRAEALASRCPSSRCPRATAARSLGGDVSWPQCPKGMGIPQKRSTGLPMPVTPRSS